MTWLKKYRIFSYQMRDLRLLLPCSLVTLNEDDIGLEDSIRYYSSLRTLFLNR